MLRCVGILSQLPTRKFTHTLVSQNTARGVRSTGRRHLGSQVRGEVDAGPALTHTHAVLFVGDGVVHARHMPPAPSPRRLPALAASHRVTHPRKQITIVRLFTDAQTKETLAWRDQISSQAAGSRGFEVKSHTYSG